MHRVLGRRSSVRCLHGGILVNRAALQGKGPIGAPIVILDWRRELAFFLSLGL